MQGHRRQTSSVISRFGKDPPWGSSETTAPFSVGHSRQYQAVSLAIDVRSTPNSDRKFNGLLPVAKCQLQTSSPSRLARSFFYFSI